MEVKKAAADVVEKLFKQCIAKNDMTGAKKFLDILVIRLADTRTEAERAALVKMMDDAEMKYEATRKARRRGAGGEDRRGEPCEHPSSRSRRSSNKANNTTRRGSARRGARRSRRTTTRSRITSRRTSSSRGLQKSKADDKILQDKISTMLVNLISIGIQTCMNAASMLMTQTDYQGALEYVNKALKVDPKNEEALEMRSQIQQASSGTGNGWGWGWGGRPGGGRPGGRGR